ncbi:MAG: hypothetical protein ABR922_05105 [Streptosporangiaceae bacterium]
MENVDWFNRRRLHEACGDIPPAEPEAAYCRQNAALAGAGQTTNRVSELTGQFRHTGIVYMYDRLCRHMPRTCGTIGDVEMRRAGAGASGVGNPHPLSLTSPAETRGTT